MHQLQNNGVRAGAVSKASDLLEDPQLKSRKYIDHFDHPDAGPSSNPGLPFQFSTMDSVPLSPQALYHQPCEAPPYYHNLLRFE